MMAITSWNWLDSEYAAQEIEGQAGGRLTVQVKDDTMGGMLKPVQLLDG
jgi:hypothetical protein